MPAQYVGLKKSFLAKGESEKAAETSAAKIFVANGKGGTRHSRAVVLAADRKSTKRPVKYGEPK